ncbi:hypothetical protein [Tunturiibacter gelidiferens]|uniref:hypothetical protein n=1 Tax=Tunturiibacter gelidiferens TaxID=3069689 RepID=UPI003D9B5190
MTDLAGKQFNSGDSEQASQTLQLVQRYTGKIHAGVTDDSKKLRDAELLMRRASFRLKGILSVATYEDRPVLEVTLKQLNEVQSELLMQVFKSKVRLNRPSFKRCDRAFSHDEFSRISVHRIGRRTGISERLLIQTPGCA